MSKLKRLGITALLSMVSCSLFAQAVVPATYAGLNAAQADSVKQASYNQIYATPDLDHDSFAKYVAGLKAKYGNIYTFIRDLNLKFKTFQADNQPPGLGFEYTYNNAWTKTSTLQSVAINQSYNLNLNGNVAFKKIYNPDNFLESKFFYNSTFLWGGTAKKNTPEQQARLKEIDRQIVKAGNAGDVAKLKSLYEQSNELVSLTDQFYVGINGSASFESNQDFSKTQFLPGFLVNVGAKAWDKTGSLRYFNLPDYPFALIRMITGTDDSFTISGASFPSALVGIDYVVPTNDNARDMIAGNLNPYARFHLESAFKTKVAIVDKQVLYFSADYRWYHELNASNAIHAASLDNFNYFVATLDSNNGFFVSYTTGRLPFDKQNTAVYGMGFHYSLGNWK